MSSPQPFTVWLGCLLLALVAMVAAVAAGAPARLFGGFVIVFGVLGIVAAMAHQRQRGESP